MQCPKCSSDNPDGAKFCMSCGTTLARKCPSCSADVPEKAKFCLECGTKLEDGSSSKSEQNLRRFIPPELLSKLESAQQAGGMEGERRNVTMLFCDVKGSTAAAEKMDPEEWADIMNDAFEHLIAPVYRYEGTLARLMGDAILAFFGAPIAHEDDPERAVMAALDIIDEVGPLKARIKKQWGIDFDVRVGINTGLVVVGNVGSDLRVEYTVMGDAVNTAARMEQTAKPGTVQIAEDTHKLVSKLFEFEDLGGVDVKGKAEPVQVFRVLGMKERPATTRGIEGLTAPMIGRDKELAELRDAFDCIVKGRGRIVSVQGEAGLGKSRLITELKEGLEADGVLDQVDWYEGRSLSYETAKTFAPARGIVAALLGIGAGDAPTTRWRRVEDTVRELLPDRVGQIAPFVGTLVEAELPEELVSRVKYLDPGQLRAELFRSLVELFEARAVKRPMVLVFEDLHWADSATIDLALELLRVSERAMLMLVAIFRPRTQEPSWRFHEAAERDHDHRYTAVKLRPLPQDDARALVSSLLAIDGLPESVRQLILDKGEGNPFFVEEVIRSLLDQGLVVRDGKTWRATAEIADVAVPDTLAAVLNTRLDKLEERAKRVVQAASVIGREFRYDELAAILTDVGGLDDSLALLERRALLRETARLPQRMFRFKHSLVQQTTYETLLLKRRRQLHAELAGYLERVQPERVEDLANHFVAARLPDRALPHLLVAGKKALGNYALPEASGAFEQALELLGEDGDIEQTRAALEGLGQAKQLRFDVPGAVDAFNRLVALGESRNDSLSVVSGLNKSAFLEGLFMGQREGAMEKVARSEDLARGDDDQPGLIESSMTRCYLHTGYGEFDTVEHYMRQVAELGEETGAEDPILFGITHLSNSLVCMCRFDEALEQAQIGLKKAKELGNLKYQGELLTFSLCTAHMARGEMEEAVRCLEEGLEIATRIGAHDSVAFATCTQGKIALAQGAYEQALALSRRTLEATEGTGAPYMMALGHCVMGTCYVEIGPACFDSAAKYHGKTLELMEMPTGTFFGTWLWSEIGQCAASAGKYDEARALFDKALTVRTMTSHLMRPQALMGTCLLELAEGNLEAAEARCVEMATYVEEKRMMHMMPTITFLKGIVAAAKGEHEAAIGSFSAAADMVAPAGMRKVLYEIRAAQARSLDALGRTAEAAACRKEAREAVDAIAAAFRDDDLRASFIEGAEAKLASASA